MDQKLKLDKWQEEVLKTEGNIVLRSGRQVGKSTIVAVKAGEYAVQNGKKSVMIISATERQAYLLFSKVLSYLLDNYKDYIKRGKDRPTKSEIKLKNGTIIRCLPTGLDGIGIRGYTNDMLIADEAAFIPEDVWTAITPSLATTKGDIILLSTPKGKQGYFYQCFNKDNFTSFHVSSEECERIDKDFLKSEKEQMSAVEYAQEYLGEFIDELQQFFPDELIKSCMTASRPEMIRKGAEYYMGVDVARMGGDENTFEIFRRTGEDRLVQVEHQTMQYVYLNEVTDYILKLHSQYDFRKIYIDDGGLGVGVFDYLLHDPTTKRRVTAINNSSRMLTSKRSQPVRKKLIKEDLYNNLRRLMEQGKIQLLQDSEIFASFKSVQYDYYGRGTLTGSLKIFGNYTHIVEGIIRAAWCIKEKYLNLEISYI